MVNVLNKSVIVILALFHRSPGKGFYYREIVRETKLNENTVNQILKKLTSLEMLKITKQGKIIYYHLNYQSSYTLAILEFYNFNYLQTLPLQTQKILAYIRSSLDSKFMCLYGPYAINQFTLKTPIDILVIVNDSALVREVPIVSKLESEFGLKINLKISKLLDSEHQKSILKSAIPFSNSRTFYETVSVWY
jgi:predicted nucleotidyltransferase